MIYMNSITFLVLPSPIKYWYAAAAINDARQNIKVKTPTTS